ncbi:MAG: hypothetical protein K2I76_01460 [Malacoplasma sp.]|nr:hypothetical protein [Malacoplasma sp.]MDE5842037.1 hypothetical protein [Malacoplasma sp.]
MNKKGYFASTGNNQYTQVEGYKTIKQKYDKKQISVLNVGMLTAGIGFLYVAALGFLLEYLVFNPLLQNISYDNDYLGTSYIVLTLAVVGLTIGSILSLVWSFRVYKASLAFAITTIFIYTTSYAVGFGSLFSYINWIYDGLSLIMVAFALVGIIFLGTFAISKLLSIKSAITLSKLIFASFGIALVAFLVVLFWSLFGMSQEAYRVIILVTSGISCLLSVLLLAYNLWLAQNMDKFYLPNELNLKVGLYIGFQMLVNLMLLLWSILRIAAAAKR